MDSQYSRLVAHVVGLALPLLLLSPRAGAQPVAAGECIAIETFAAGKVGEQPPGWKLRKDSARGVYLVQDEGGRRFLHAASKGLGIQLAKQFEWDLRAYPVLAWSWRLVEFPHGGDERESKTNDSALAVYLLVPHSRITGPKTVKYIWSERVAAGTRLESNMGLTQVRVLRSGAEQKGQWIEERVNARDDYMQAFGVTEAPKPGGIAVLTDADDTQSSAQGDYADFRACRG
jgi:Protein of unknown function (DUF3047)